MNTNITQKTKDEQHGLGTPKNMKERVGIPLTVEPHHLFEPFPSQDHHFQHEMSDRGNCSLPKATPTKDHSHQRPSLLSDQISDALRY
jgi:hypothetical protein